MECPHLDSQADLAVCVCVLEFIVILVIVISNNSTV